MRKNLIKFVYALAALFIAAMPSASAQFVNPGFESGVFAPWQTAANASISTGFNQNQWLVTPADTRMARIEPIGGQTRSTAEAFLGLTPGSFTAFNPTIFNPTTNYGSIKQSVFLGAGQTVTCYWNYVSTDYVPFNDGAIACLVGPSGQQLKLLAVTESAYGSPGAIVTGSYGSTGWHTVSFTAGLPGLYTLGFTTFNDADQVLNPILFLDDAAGGTSAPGQPVVVTANVTNVTTNTATTGGNVTSDGGSPVTTRGVVYSTSPLPTLANGMTADGAGTGSYISNLSGLSMGTTYYVRAYATNNVGTSYGNEEIFTTSACNLGASTSVTNVSCFGGSNGSVTVTATGGTAPMTGEGTFSGLAAGTYTYTLTDASGCTAEAIVTVTEPNVLEASATATNALCNGLEGSIEVAATGGTAPYTGTGSYNVVAGTYTYTVTDANGCSAEATATVTEPDVLEATATATNALCNGLEGSIEVTATGGTAPYTGTGSYNVLAGTYTYTVTDANGCSTEATATVTEPDVLVASAAATNALCNGLEGSINVTATGGTAPYTGTGSYNVVAGTYTYTVTDANGCSSEATATVTEPDVLACNTTVNPNPTVAGQQQNTIFLGYGPQSVAITANVTGGTAPYSYSWSNGATTASTTVSPTTTTAYTVTITDANGCVTTCIRTIFVKDVRDGKKILICHIPPGNPGNAHTLSVAAAAVPAHLAHGDYLGACNNNARMAGNEEGENVLGEMAEELHFHIYPNPSNGNFVIELPKTGTTDVVITDVSGKVIVKQTLIDNAKTELQYDLRNEAKGLYFIRIVNGGEVYVSKITLE